MTSCQCHTRDGSSEDDFLDCVTDLITPIYRDMLYRCDVPSLLSGNLTQLSIEEQAARRLRDLAAVRQKDEPTSDWPIIFVAYDIAALVVKAAIVLATTLEKEYPGLFLRTSHVVFFGCPQRSPSPQAMESKLMEYLCNSKHTAWMHLLTAISIRYLARAVQQATHAFINSKITLRCRIISLYAAAEPRTIPSALDFFTATLGVQREKCIQENGPGNEERIPGLQDLLMLESKNLIPLPRWIPQGNTLMLLSATHRQSQLRGSPAVISPLLENEEYLQWEGFMGPKILYLDGTRRNRICDIADRIQAIWKAKKDEHGGLARRHFSFTFDSTDPSRDTLADMAAALVLEIVSEEGGEWFEDSHIVLDGLFRFRGGWPEESCLALFDCFTGQFGTDLIMVWHYLDECSPETRTMLLDFLANLAKRNETPLKVVVTSRQPAALLPEMRNWVTINVDELYTDVSTPNAGSEWTIESVSDSLVQQCPSEVDKQHIREGLARFAAADKDDVSTIVSLLCNHTGWPEEPSSEAMALFSDLLYSINPRDTPQQVLDSILRSNADMDGLRWVLSWLLCAYRPLTMQELSVVLCFRPKQQEGQSGGCLTELPALSMMQRASEQLEAWLRVLVDFRHNQVRLRDEVRDLLAEDGDSNEYIWNEIRGSAHRILAEFCLTQLATEETKAFLDTAVQGYKLALQRPQAPDTAPITAPIASDGRRLVFYVVQALPYHLLRCPSEYVAKALESLIKGPASLSYTLWAKTNWAMSNPFTRGVKPPESALAVLVGHGLIPYDQVKQTDETTRSQCLVAASHKGRRDIAAKFLQDKSHTITILTDALLAATQAGNESLALDIAHQMLSVSPAAEHDTLWPESLIWAAAWLDMDRLADAMLSNGASPDPQTDRLVMNTEFYPTALYIASLLGRTQVVEVLLKHNARTDLLRDGVFGSFYAAASAGDPEMLRAYLAKDPSLLQSRQPRSPLANAVQQGNWAYAEALIAAGMDVNAKEDYFGDGRTWSPLLLACAWGLPKTTELLLKHKADPNIIGPGDMDTPLWFATVRSASVDCTRLLLQYGSDPNHENLDPPLMYELSSSRKRYETILAVCDLLITNDPPVDVNRPEKNNGYTPLMVACRTGRLPLFAWLLEHGADVNAVDFENRDVLHHAVASDSSVSDSDRLAVVKKLLERHPNLETVNSRNGETAVHAALEHSDVFRLLLDAGASPETVTVAGATLINRAVQLRVNEVAKILVERKVDLDHADSYGWKPIFDAVGLMGDASLVRLLAEGGATLRGTSGGQTLLKRAIYGPPDVMRTLLEFRKSLDLEERNSAGQTPLLSVARSHNIGSIKVLIQAGADINAEGPEQLTPLTHAMVRDQPDYVALLLAQPDIDVTRIAPRYGGALHLACFMLDVKVVLNLFDHGADVNAVNSYNDVLSPLFATLIAPRWHDNVDQIVRILVQNGADVRQTSKHILHTAISAACLGAGTSTINFLLDEGASPQQASPITGALPLHYAAANGLQTFQTILLPYRGDMMAADHRGKNCLHWAAEFGNAQTVKYILDRLGSSESTAAIDRYINQADNDGWTPLCWALRCQNPMFYVWNTKSERMKFTETVRLLLAHGAHSTVTCRWNPVEGAEQLTMLELAQRCRAPDEIVEQLKAGTEAAPGQNAKPVRRYRMLETYCGVCLARILGFNYKCTTCLAFNVCTKCFPSIGDIHNGDTFGDGKPHKLERYGDEYDGPLEEAAQEERSGDSSENSENDLGFMDMDEDM